MTELLILRVNSISSLNFAIADGEELNTWLKS